LASRIADSKPKKGGAVVMWNRWRLIAGQELYDLAADPAQAAHVAGRFPEVVAQMRRH